MEEMRSILEDSIKSIEQSTDFFYQQRSDEGYKQLSNTLALLTETMNSIFTYKAQGNDIGIEEDKLVQVLIEALKATEMKDTILLSDILLYDLKELLEKVLSTVSNQ